MLQDDIQIDIADGQRFAICGQVIPADALDLQLLLARIHDSAERPRCLCVPGGVEMYVARHQRYLIKRMPDTGRQHHPTCPSFSPEGAGSGLGELMGEAVLEREPGRIELRVDFPWTRWAGKARAAGVRQEPGEVSVPRRRMSLRAVLHLLFERAGFNRWSPAMAGKRNQGVLCHYLLQAAEEVEVAGAPLASRLIVPESFNSVRMAEIERRRQCKLAALQPHEGQTPVGLVVGEFKTCDRAPLGCRVWIRHMPDLPLRMPMKSWDRLVRQHGPMLDAWHEDSTHRMRIAMAALVRARSECAIEVEAATLMLVSKDWIPLEGVHELALVEALITQGRRFLKPLRYDAARAGGFANALLLDAGPTPLPMHVWSGLLPKAELALKERAMAGEQGWSWRTSEPMPDLPPQARYGPLSASRVSKAGSASA